MSIVETQHQPANKVTYGMDSSVSTVLEDQPPARQVTSGTESSVSITDLHPPHLTVPQATTGVEFNASIAANSISYLLAAMDTSGMEVAVATTMFQPIVGQDSIGMELPVWVRVSL